MRVWKYLLFSIAVLFIAHPTQAVEKHLKLDNPTALPNFQLEDELGEPFSLSHLQGSWSLVTIGFTSCPDICPFVLSNLSAVIKKMDQLGVQNKPAVVFVAVDPFRDRPVIKDYVSHFGDNIVGLTGSHSELKKLATGIGGNYIIEQTKSDGSYDVKHSAFVVLVSPSGDVLARLNPPLKADHAAKFLLEIINPASAAIPVQ